MRLSLGADEHLHIVDELLQYLKEKGYEVFWHGPEHGQIKPWPQVAIDVTYDIINGKAQEGILLCWTGTGVCLAANKVRGIRAALCVDAETARGARLWNNANVLCLSMRLTSPAVVREILDQWLGTAYVANPVDDACLKLVEKIENQLNAG